MVVRRMMTARLIFRQISTSITNGGAGASRKNRRRTKPIGTKSPRYSRSLRSQGGILDALVKSFHRTEDTERRKGRSTKGKKNKTIGRGSTRMNADFRGPFDLVCVELRSSAAAFFLTLLL